MAQIREIKSRIKSINNTAKVTHAMELVAAAKMRRSQESALASRPYTNILNEVLNEVRAKSEQNKQKLLSTVENADHNLIIFITTDRGLVGGLNINLFRLLSAHPRGELSSTPAHPWGVTKSKFVTVGKKATQFVTKTGGEIIASFLADETTPIELARTLTKIATDAYTNAEVKAVKIFYPDFQSTIKQVPSVTQLLPIELEENLDVQAHPRGELSSTSAHPGGVPDMLFEPSANQILDVILPHYVLTRIYQVLLEAKASEHSARMVAMKNATDAANDLVDDLTLTYNQARQEAITKELLDIVTAQKAFE